MHNVIIENLVKCQTKKKGCNHIKFDLNFNHLLLSTITLCLKQNFENPMFFYIIFKALGCCYLTKPLHVSGAEL